MTTRMVKKPEEIAILREGGRLLAMVLSEVVQNVKPGVTTMELNDIADRGIRKVGGIPSFVGYGGGSSGKGSYPCALCTSVNDEVVHMIPHHEKFLRDGDIIGLDIGMQYRGLFTDHAVTVAVGKISSQAQQLIDVTRAALMAGIERVRSGATLGDVGFAIQKIIEEGGFGVVRELVGHGVGYAVHEPPQIPNYGQSGKGLVLKSGMVLAIEPMANVGSPDVEFSDHWAVYTADQSLSAHFEHTVVVTESGYEILTLVP